MYFTYRGTDEASFHFTKMYKITLLYNKIEIETTWNEDQTPQIIITGPVSTKYSESQPQK